MSSTSFDSPRIPPTSARFEIRKSSLTGPATYERPANFVARRRTPSPGPSRRPYDSYVPPRSAASSSYRDDYSNVYRPNNYRPDYPASGYYGRSPSPDRYLPHRSAEPEVWDRPTPWLERKTPVAPPSPAVSSRSRGHKDDVLATRMFEPSETWKQTHVDRPRIDTASSSNDRYADRISPDGPSRRSPVHIPGGDRYRPGPPKRDLYSSSRSDYDSYRPSRRGRTPDRSPSPADDRRRRDSASSSYARPYDHYEPAYGGFTPSRYRSRSPNASSRSVSPRSRSDRGREGYPTKRKASRQSSRSSIASTRASEPETGPAPAVKHGGQDLTNLQVSAALPNVSEANTLLNGENKTSVDSKPLTSAQITASATQDNIQADSAVIALNGAKHPASSTSTLPPVNSVNGDEDRSTPPGFVQRQLSRTALKHNILPSPTPSATPMSISSSATPAPTPFVHAPLPTAEEILKPETISSPPKAVQMNGTASSAMVSISPSMALLPSTPANALPFSGNASDDKLLSKVDTVTVSSSAMISYPSSIAAAPPKTADAIMTSAYSPTATKSDLAAKSDANSLLTEPPTFADAKSIAEALRVVVMTRLLCDRQRREDRVDPVLLRNQLISPGFRVRADATSPEALVEELYSGERLEKRRQAFLAAKPSLVEHLQKRHELVAGKTQQLKEDYTSMHEKWKAHCVALNEQSRTSLASEIETIQHSGRTTRRSTAITDAVRSDLEMEQIIASLGNDDATDPNHLSVRNLATIPDMVSVTHGQVDYVFDDTNHAVENPKEYYGPHTGIHDWTDEEKSIFIDKFAAFPKQFGIIADYLPNKTSAQCVDYYYLHKKRLIDFRKIVSQFAPNKRRRGGTRKKKGNGLLADIAQHDAEVHQRDATIPARATRGRKAAQPESRRSVNARKAAVQFEDTPTSTPTPEPEATRQRRRKSGPNPAPSTPATPTPFSAPSSHPPAQPLSEVASVSAVSVVSATADEDEITEEERRPTKKAKRPRKTVKSAAIINDEPEGPSTESVVASAESSEPTSGLKRSGGIIIQWDEKDKKTFLSLLAQYGDDFKRIAASMPNKTSIQVRNYYKFNGPALNLEKVAAQAPKRSPTPETRDGWKEPLSTGILTSRPAPIVDTAPPMASLTHDTTASPSTSALPSNSSQPQDASRHTGTEAASKPSLTWMNGVGSRHLIHAIAPARPVDTPGMSPNHTRHYPTATYDTPPLNARPGSGAYPTPNVYSSYTQHGLPYHKYYSMPPRPPIPTSAPMHHSLIDVRAAVTRQAGAASPTANRVENPYSAYSVPPAATTSEVAALRRPYYYPP